MIADYYPLRSLCAESDHQMKSDVRVGKGSELMVSYSTERY